MKAKKTKKADLNNYSSTFILIGLVVVMISALQLINLKIYESSIDIGKLSFDAGKEDETIEVKIEEPKPKIKVIKKELVNLKIKKDDDKKIKEDLFKETEIKDNDTIVEVKEIITEEVEEAIIDVPFNFVQQVPTYPGCEGKKGEKLKKCLADKIRKFVGKKFNTGIAQDLGLSGEKVRILTQFTIDENGKITKIKARSKYKDLENEAKRVINNLPKMKPGIQHNRKVRVTYSLPIVFNVEEE